MADAPKIRIREVTLYARPVRTRIPFRFGVATLKEMPIAHLRIEAECTPGGLVAGASAVAMPYLWFDKNPKKSHDETVQDLSTSVRNAAALALDAGSANAYDLHSQIEPEARRRGRNSGLNELTSGFGVALLDLAVIDALCRTSQTTFHAGLRGNLFGLGTDFGKLVPEKPLESVAVRHTIGMADPLTGADLNKRLDDGLPETLEEVVREYGVTWFKIKITGDVAAAVERLNAVAAVLDKECGRYKVTLDANEQFPDMNRLIQFVRKMSRNQRARHLWRQTIWIEQPLDRSDSIRDDVALPLREITSYKPVVIDEADESDEAVERALELGYNGTSAKNCKGVFRTLHSFRVAHQRAASGKGDTILSGEDLTNVPVYPLQQDLAVVAALGIAHTERNGHHYVRGFDFLSPSEREAALREFPSLYAKNSVAVRDGSLSTADVNRHGFGVLSEPDWDFLKKI